MEVAQASESSGSRRADETHCNIALSTLYAPGRDPHSDREATHHPQRTTGENRSEGFACEENCFLEHVQDQKIAGCASSYMGL
jgi:hypothetical protein